VLPVLLIPALRVLTTAQSIFKDTTQNLHRSKHKNHHPKLHQVHKKSKVFILVSQDNRSSLARRVKQAASGDTCLKTLEKQPNIGLTAKRQTILVASVT